MKSEGNVVLKLVPWRAEARRWRRAAENWPAYVIAVLTAAFPAAYADTAAHGISAALINVVQNDTNNTAGSVTVTAIRPVNDFRLRDDSNRGDFNVQIGEAYSDDVEAGVLMSCVAENGRDNGEDAWPGTNHCTSTIDYSRTGASAGGYFISSFNTPAGAEFNLNIAAAFFPYSKWLGGLARNVDGTNGGPNDLLTGSPGLVPGVHFVENGGGVFTINLSSFGVDSRSDGVLLVSGGKNEDNYALSRVNDDGTWTVYVKDNGTDAGVYEQDPVAFVFIPKTNNLVISGRFRSDGTPLLFSGLTPRFSVTNLGVGTWKLTIPGHSPSSGVLVISAEGGTSLNQDNIVSYQPDDEGWIIQSRDLPGGGLQTPGNSEAVASFVFVPLAAESRLVAPGNNATKLEASPTLQVAVTNAAAGNLTVKFYGRVGAMNTSPDFTVVALPDTQFYTDSAHGGQPGMFYAQTEWIITNRVARNIAYVAHLGDIVDHGDNNGGNPPAEWRVATNAMYRIENPVRTLLADGIAYGLAVGNHDQSPNGAPDGTTFYFNQYFGVPHFDGRAYYAGHYGTNNDNHYDVFSAGGMDFIALYFEYDTNANPAVLAWGNEVLRSHANRRAIVVTHYAGTPVTPCNFSRQGAVIYNALKTNANFFMMLGGHVNGEGSRVDTFNGRAVHTLISDYQGRTNGGNGYLRIMTFSPSNNLVVVQSYSPWTGEYETDADSEFWFNYDMQEPLGAGLGEFELIGTVSNVPPGAVASLAWPGRAYNTAYEWRVTVVDPRNDVTTSPVWRFSTDTNRPPVAFDAGFTVTGDTSVNVTPTAFDPDGDSLTFETNSPPLHGITLNFAPNTGAVTYQPVHGFRGLDHFDYYASDGVSTSALATLSLNVVAPVDTNTNGLPDVWEAAFGVSDPVADDDGDGMNNLDEYFANTNPTNAASVFRITSVGRDGDGHTVLTWSSVGGTRYRVQFSDGVAAGGVGDSFTDVVLPLSVETDPAPVGMASTHGFVDDFKLTGAPANVARYYRIKIVQ